MAEERLIIEKMKKNKEAEMMAINGVLKRTNINESDLLKAALLRADQLSKAVNSEKFGKEE